MKSYHFLCSDEIIKNNISKYFNVTILNKFSVYVAYTVFERVPKWGKKMICIEKNLN